MKTCNIIIAEDEKIIALDIKRTLQTIGHNVTSVVASGEAAIEKCRSEKPDIILLDIRLRGEIDGIKAAEIIYNEMKISIIHLSALKKGGHQEKFSYPFIFIAKPFEKKDLQDAIEKIQNNNFGSLD